MADGGGLDVLIAAHEIDAALSVVLLTACASIKLAVESMRRGAFDFITKPFVPEALLASAHHAVEHTRLLRENGRLRDAVSRLEGSSEIRGGSAAIRELREKIARVALTNVTVLITGETGTAAGRGQLRRIHRHAAGKRVVRTRARRVHRGQPRPRGPVRSCPSGYALPARSGRAVHGSASEAVARAHGRTVT
jgi:two-component system C4-dicarboxylate transport response regulator DctD